MILSIQKRVFRSSICDMCLAYSFVLINIIKEHNALANNIIRIEKIIV